MATKKELEEQIKKLKAQLTDDKPPLEVGEFYKLSTGLAKVIRFYKEDGHNKIQSEIRMFDSRDGKTPVGESSLCSMPVDAFYKRMGDYTLDQQQREKLNKRGAK